MIEVPQWFSRDVSRETLEKLETYKNLLEKWTRKINLISKSTIEDISERHIWDSAQIYQQTQGKWVDLGSGGGLPGVVLAILAEGWNEPLNLTLVESDQRKATFLRACAREIEVSINVSAKRIEMIEVQNADVVSARALTDLNSLIEMSFRHLAPGGLGVFMKGARWKAEVEDARKNWLFLCDAVLSKTSPEAAILKIRDIQRV
ncbi:16S rRNA (guanine(527)-N(7))-methyltransferase RsmG [Tateyamaria pelophila]|uniref:16S rRNA (guanine(527)-N(7))-methyltransferase RsmG n=1 Tax=Tateyamaria pelophila TaxID=328415 RepID=UPI001CBF03CC|nr:16S rRNA (guanine(527)-N(7))-methyltransferase RsmG [Tateyamaria pelophila]